MKGAPWTAAQLDMLRAHYPHRSTREVAALTGRSACAVSRKAAALGVRKTAAFLASEASGRKQRGHSDARCVAAQFKPGQTPWNKGLHYMPGGNSMHTHFKPGRAVHEHRLYLPLGTLRVARGGYLERKTSDDRALYPAARWTPVHRLVWEAAHGPVPAGSVVVFKPGRRSTVEAQITLDALELVTRSELMARNTVQRLGPEIAAAVRARGALVRRIRRIERVARCEHERNAVHEGATQP